MTALSIAEAEPPTEAYQQVSGVVGGTRRRVVTAGRGLASVTELAGAASRKGHADPENFRHAGVSRSAGVPRRAAPPPPAGVSRVSRPAPVAGPVRLTARGRVVVVGLIGAVAVCVGTLLAAGGAAAASHGSPGAGYQGMHQIVVEPGQTLWSIASAAAPAADPQAAIQQIESANSLSTGIIHPGQVLWVPRG